MRSGKGALSERARLDWVAFRRVSKSLRNKEPCGTEHFTWELLADPWDNATIFREGCLNDIPWPDKVWNCQTSSRSVDEEDGETKLQPAYSTSSQATCSPKIASSSAVSSA